MIGRNHVTVNVATAAAGVSGICMLAYTENILQMLALKAIDFLIPVDSLGMKILYLAAGAILFIFGSLLPDIDNKQSALGRYFYLPVTHRTITHTAWMVLLFVLIGIRLRLFLFLAAGVFFHIFYDGLSSAGIAWFWPLSRYIRYSSGAMVKKGFRFKLYKTGEISEKLITWLVCGLCGLFTFWAILKIVLA